MKIGILTQPLRANYGGLLQGWALQQVLARMGHEAWIVRRDGRDITHTLPLWLRRQVANAAKSLGGGTPVKWISRREERLIHRYVRLFSDKQVNPRTQVMHSSAALRRDYAARRYDAYVVGSDQVWRPSYIDGLTDYFLGFLPGAAPVRRVAYAASFGTDEWEYSERQAFVCRRLLGRFDAVSVRERGGVTLCEGHLGVEARWVLDPTLLLDPADYEALAEADALQVMDADGMEAVPVSGAARPPGGMTNRELVAARFRDEPSSPAGRVARKGEMFACLLDKTDRLQTLCHAVADRLDCEPFGVMPEAEGVVPCGTPLSAMRYRPVSVWLSTFMDADCVLTDSYHGCVFSLLFHRPFVALGNPARGQGRFTSLLGLFGLSERIADGLSADEVARRMNVPVDWGRVDAVRHEWKALSCQFLARALGGEAVR